MHNDGMDIYGMQRRDWEDDRRDDNDVHTEWAPGDIVELYKYLWLLSLK